MKLVQIAILACMVVAVGLLFQIYRGQDRLEPLDQELPAISDTSTVEFEMPASPPGPPEGAAEAAEVKPSPAPAASQRTSQRNPRRPSPRPAPRQSQTQPESVAETRAPNDSRPASDQGQAEPVREAIRIEEPTRAAAQPPPPPPPQPRRVTLPSGAEFVVRLTHSLSTRRNYPGDTFYASLDEPIVVDGLVVAEKGAKVEGRVLEAERSGRLKGRSLLSIELVRLNTADGQTVDIVTNRQHRRGEESKADDAKKVGLGAGIGAIVGAIAGGGKGAAIGAGVGAGAGGGAVAATRGRPAEIPSETRLYFRLIDPLEIVEKL